MYTRRNELKELKKKNKNKKIKIEIKKKKMSDDVSRLTIVEYLTMFKDS